MDPRSMRNDWKPKHIALHPISRHLLPNVSVAKLSIIIAFFLDIVSTVPFERSPSQDLSENLFGCVDANAALLQFEAKATIFKALRLYTIIVIRFSSYHLMLSLVHRWWTRRSSAGPCSRRRCRAPSSRGSGPAAARCDRCAAGTRASQLARAPATSWLSIFADILNFKVKQGMSKYLK